MKKNMRKILSLVLAMVMILSLSVTAFAAETSTATIKIYNGTTLIATLHPEAGTTIYNALEAAEEDGDLDPVNWKNVTGWPDTTQTHQALTQINTYVSHRGSAADLADTDFSNVTENQAVDGYPGYYLVDQNNGYHYVYVGFDWTFNSNLHLNEDGSYAYISSYMCCYALTAGETVNITFAKAVSDWTQDSALGE